MQMTNSELAELLNIRLELSGKDAVTADVVRLWVAWDLLPKATAQGRAIGKSPIWSRSNAAIRRAMRLSELRRRGIRRENALITQAYIEWGHPDFDRVKEALLNEWSKWASQLIRRQTTFLGDSEFHNISVTKRRAFATQLGPLDSRFQGTQFEQSPEFYAVLSELSRTGNANSEHVTALMSAALQRLSPGVIETLPFHCIGVLANSFAGMTGVPDEIENSAESTILNASERQFRIARYQIRLFLKELCRNNPQKESAILDYMPRQLWQMLDLLSPQISTGPWLIFAFVQALKTTEVE